jgi:hypothetical protein
MDLPPRRCRERLCQTNSVSVFQHFRFQRFLHAALLRRLAEIDKTLLVHDVTLREILQKLRPLSGTASTAFQTRNWLPCQRRRGSLPWPEEELNGACARTWNNVVSARAEAPRHFRPQQLDQAKPQWAITRGESLQEVSIVRTPGTNQIKRQSSFPNRCSSSRKTMSA